jgi:transposase
MMVDPASPDFLNLSPRNQARVYYFDIGWDEDAIADEMDISIVTIERWLDTDIEEGPTMRPRRPRRNHQRRSKPSPVVPAVPAAVDGTPVSLEELRALYERDGLSMPQIAERFGRSYSWARDQLLQSGIKPRSKGHRGQITRKVA